MRRSHHIIIASLLMLKLLVVSAAAALAAVVMAQTSPPSPSPPPLYYLPTNTLQLASLPSEYATLSAAIPSASAASMSDSCGCYDLVTADTLVVQGAIATTTCALNVTLDAVSLAAQLGNYNTSSSRSDLICKLSVRSGQNGAVLAQETLVAMEHLYLSPAAVAVVEEPGDTSVQFSLISSVGSISTGFGQVIKDLSEATFDFGVRSTRLPLQLLAPILQGTTSGGQFTHSVSFQSSAIRTVNSTLASSASAYIVVGLEMYAKKKGTEDVVWTLPLSKPLIIYKQPVISDVKPRLIRNGFEPDKLVISRASGTPNFIDANDFVMRDVTSSKLVTVRMGDASDTRPPSSVYSDSIVIDTVDSPAKLINNGVREVFYAQDGRSFVSAGADRRVFVFDWSSYSSSSISYSDGLAGCSVMGSNNVTFDLSSVLSGLTSTNAADVIAWLKAQPGPPQMKIRHASGFSRTSPQCVLSNPTDSTWTVNCVCPEAWDVLRSLQLNSITPLSFSWSLMINGQSWMDSESVPQSDALEIKIPYVNPATMQFGTKAVDALNDRTVVINNAQDYVDLSRFTYKYYFIQASSQTWKKTDALAIDPSMLSWQGSVLSITVPLPSNEELDQLCDCRLESTIPGTVETECMGLCSIQFVLKPINIDPLLAKPLAASVGFSPLVPLTVYGERNYEIEPLVPSAMLISQFLFEPQIIVKILSAQPSTHHTFVSGFSYWIKFNESVDSVASDVFLQPSEQPLQSQLLETPPINIIAYKNSSELTVDMPKFTAGQLSGRSNIALRPLLSVNGGRSYRALAPLYTKLAVDQAQTDMHNSLVKFRLYDSARFSFEEVTTSSGSMQSIPTRTPLSLIGQKFFPADSIKIKYSMVAHPDVKLSESCTFASDTVLSCMTPNVISTGLRLPANFTLSISIGTGQPHFDANLALGSILFLPSNRPVIVQVTPQRGPIDPSDNPLQLISIKGLVTNVDKCILRALDDTIYSPEEAPTFVFDAEPKQSSFAQEVDEVVCKIDTELLSSNISLTRSNSQFQQRFVLSVRTSTNLDSLDGFRPFIFYRYPVISDFEPKSGPAQGKVQLTIAASERGAPFPRDYPIKLKLGQYIQTAPCTVLSSGYNITCETPAQPEDQSGVDVWLTFNEGSHYMKSQASIEGPTESITIKYRPRPCSPGFTAEDYTKQCTECPIGTYKPQEGFFQCIACDTTRFQNETAQSTCKRCPAFTETKQFSSIQIAQCDCIEGYYRKNDSSPGIACTPCPTGGICAGRDAFPLPKPGYWFDEELYVTTGRISFLNCPIPEVCVGGNLSQALQCAEGYTGVMCQFCAKNHYKSNDSCLVCNNDVRWRFLVIVLVLGVVLGVVFKFAELKVSHLSSISIALSYFQIIAVFSAYQFKWPPELKEALLVFKFLNLDLDLFVPECITDVTWGLKYGLTLAIPAAFALGLLSIFLLECLRSFFVWKLGIPLRTKLASWLQVDHRNYALRLLTSFRKSVLRFIAVPSSTKELKRFGDKCIHTFVVLISFSYIFVVTKATQVFDCRFLSNGDVVLGPDPTTICYSHFWWTNYFIPSVLVLVLFGGGVLVVFGVLLLRRNKLAKDPAFNERFRFLFVRFRKSRLWWELVIMMRKLLISLAIVFFARFAMLIVIFTMITIFTAFILHTHNQPFRRPNHNTMEYVQLLATEFLLFSGLLFYVDSWPDAWNRVLLGWLCIIVIVGTSVLMVLMVLNDFWQQLREDRHRKLAKRAKLQAAQVKQVDTQDVQAQSAPGASAADVELKDMPATTTQAPAATVVSMPMDNKTKKKLKRQANMLFGDESDAQVDLPDTPLDKLVDLYDKLAARVYARFRLCLSVLHSISDRLQGKNEAERRDEEAGREARRAQKHKGMPDDDLDLSEPEIDTDTSVMSSSTQDLKISPAKDRQASVASPSIPVDSPVPESTLSPADSSLVVSPSSDAPLFSADSPAPSSYAVAQGQFASELPSSPGLSTIQSPTDSDVADIEIVQSPSGNE